VVVVAAVVVPTIWSLGRSGKGLGLDGAGAATENKEDGAVAAMLPTTDDNINKMRFEIHTAAGETI
jgi:hypothetical protein